MKLQIKIREITVRYFINNMLYTIFCMMILISCNQDEIIDSDTKDILLRISTDAPVTYGELNPQEAIPFNFNSGNLYLTNDAGLIIRHFTISNDKGESASNINLEDIISPAGVLLSDLPGTITKLYVIGNTEIPVDESNYIISILSKTLTFASQSNMDNLNLYGEGYLSPKLGGASNQYVSIISIRPIIARVELKDISCTGDIKSFTLEGIFIDNYYSESTVNGSLLESNFVDNENYLAAFNNNTTAYLTILQGFTYDWYEHGITSKHQMLEPSFPKVWGYNIFAGYQTACDVPKIVLRLKDITTYSGTTYSNPQFVEATQFAFNGTMDTRISSGCVYKISSGVLKFNENNLISGIP